jgi:hypothetical protein
MAYTRVDGILAYGRKNLEVTAAATEATVGAVTYTVAQILGGLILRDPNGAGRADLVPTAAALLAAIKSGIPGVSTGGTNGVPPPVGTSFVFTIRNTADAAETITVTTNTGVTLSGTMTIAQNNSKEFLLVFTDVRDGNAAYTLYSLGTSVF